MQNRIPADNLCDRVRARNFVSAALAEGVIGIPVVGWQRPVAKSSENDEEEENERPIHYHPRLYKKKRESSPPERSPKGERNRNHEVIEIESNSSDDIEEEVGGPTSSRVRNAVSSQAQELHGRYPQSAHSGDLNGLSTESHLLRVPDTPGLHSLPVGSHHPALVAHRARMQAGGMHHPHFMGLGAEPSSLGLERLGRVPTSYLLGTPPVGQLSHQAALSQGGYVMVPSSAASHYQHAGLGPGSMLAPNGLADPRLMYPGGAAIGRSHLLDGGVSQRSLQESDYS